MAITKMWAIKDRLDVSLAYISNEEKTIDKVMKYVSRNEATENQKYVTCINCNANDPYEDMMNVKRIFHKTDSKRLAFHAVQSFEPGEGNPDMVHEIGVKLATELFGDEYQIVVTTHLDKDHLHNHILINSTSFKTGKQFTNSKKDRKRMMEVSDRLCKEYELSVIENPQTFRKENYNKNRNFIKEIQKDFDDAIQHAVTTDMVYRNMMLEGYDFITLDSIDCIVHPYCIEPIPLRQLGKRYSEEAIKEKVIGLETKSKYQFKSFAYLYEKRKELSGFQKLYYRFLYSIGVLPDYQVNKSKLTPEARKELKELDLISHETELFVKYNINSIDDLKTKLNEFQNEMDQLIQERKNYYQKGCKMENPIEREKLYLQAKGCTPRIKELRNQIKLLNHAENRSIRLVDLNKQLDKKKEKER